jgi:predicted GNAT family N-acyltransferase
VISTAVLVPEGKDYKMQRVVVKQGMQDSGIGSKMMEFCEDYARNQNIRSVYCHARDSAVNFYLKNGYLAEGDYFDEDTIPHLKMRKVL